MKKEIYTVLVDSTDDGEYQNNAHVRVFPSFEEAKKYVEEDILDTQTNDDNQAEAKWYGADEAQYRRGDIIVDWKIGMETVEL